MPDEAILLEGVTKRFGPRAALEGVSFSVSPGEAVGYLGPNGAGKSTTFRLLTGLLRPDAGRVRVLGADPSSAAGATRERIGALVESPGLPPFLCVSDLLFYVAAVKGIGADRRPTEVRRTAALMGVETRLPSSLRALSSGLLRRVLIAATLVGHPGVLLLDEPTNGLDPAARHDLRATLRDLHREGQTLLISTHLLEDVERVCDRVVFLREGRIVGDEPVRNAGSSDGTGVELARVRFLDPVAREQIAPRLFTGESVVEVAGREVTVRLSAGEDRRASFLRGLVESGLRPVSLGEARGGLESRYLETVGREEDR